MRIKRSKAQREGRAPSGAERGLRRREGEAQTAGAKQSPLQRLQQGRQPARQVVQLRHS